VNPTGERAGSDSTMPHHPWGAGAVGTSRCSATAPGVSKIERSALKRLTLLVTEMVTGSTVKICYSLLCFPLGNTL